MKTVKNYDKFSEEYILNENLLKKAWTAIVNFFKGKYKKDSWFYYGLFLIKNNLLPKEKVEIILPNSYNIPKDLPTENEIDSVKKESLDGLEISYSLLNEDVINLDHPDPKVRNIDVEDLKEKIITAYNINKGKIDRGEKITKKNAVFIWGAPGIGKTEILNQVANTLDIEVIELHLSQMEATDFRGVPRVEDVTGSGNIRDFRTVTHLPELFPISDNPTPGKLGKGGILFFDELNRAHQTVLSAALSLCLSGKIGSYSLPPHWIVVAAGNRPSDLGWGAKVTKIEPALANRFAHVNYSPSIKSWIDWAIKKENMNPDIVGFIKFKPQYFHMLDPDQEPIAFPSPRSWEQASDEEYAVRGYDWGRKLPYDKIRNIYTDYIGLDAATAFVGYLELKEHYNEKDVEDVYSKGAKAKPLPTRPDYAFAATASIASYKRGKKLTVDELTNLLDFALKGIKDLEQRTPLLSYFKDVHPEVKTDDPYKAIWWDYIKLWHKELKGMEE